MADKVKWFIAECKPTRERTIRNDLQKAGYEAFVASQKETKVYKSRNKREVERVLIGGLIFVHIEEKRLMEILLNFSSVWRFQKNRAASPDANGILPFATVPEDQMLQLQYVLGQADNPVVLSADDFVPEQEVRVMRGPLEGLRGWFLKKGRSCYIKLRIEMGQTQYYETEVLLEDVQPI